MFIDLASGSSTARSKALWRDFIDYGISRGKFVDNRSSLASSIKSLSTISKVVKLNITNYLT